MDGVIMYKHNHTLRKHKHTKNTYIKHFTIENHRKYSCTALPFDDLMSTPKFDQRFRPSDPRFQNIEQVS